MIYIFDVDGTLTPSRNPKDLDTSKRELIFQPKSKERLAIPL